MAPPLWAHADLAVGCLDAGKHVLCEKMMAWDVESCERMREAAPATIACSRSDTSASQPHVPGRLRRDRQGRRARRHLPRAARLASERSWRRKGGAAVAGLRPVAVGLPDFDHLLNWRLYWKYSQG